MRSLPPFVKAAAHPPLASHLRGQGKAEIPLIIRGYHQMAKNFAGVVDHPFSATDASVLGFYMLNHSSDMINYTKFVAEFIKTNGEFI